MKSLTIFVQIDSDSEQNAVKWAIRQVAKAFGATPVDALVQGEEEATIAVTNSVRDALRWVKETEQTAIVLASFKKEEREEAEALAGRFPARISAVPFVGRSADDEFELVPFLLKLITEKGKEVK